MASWCTRSPARRPAVGTRRVVDTPTVDSFSIYIYLPTKDLSPASVILPGLMMYLGLLMAPRPGSGRYSIYNVQQGVLQCAVDALPLLTAATSTRCSVGTSVDDELICTAVAE